MLFDGGTAVAFPRLSPRAKTPQEGSTAAEGWSSLLVRGIFGTVGVPLRFPIALVPEEGRLVSGITQVFRPPCSFAESAQEGSKKDEADST
jgi:hypothetical protein